MNNKTQTQKQNLVNATLDLFNVVPKLSSSNKPKFFEDYGILVESEASSYLDEITEWLKSRPLSSRQLNSSFHKSWKKVRNASMEDLVKEQIIHYLTTYGLEELGLYSSDLIYIPEEELEIPVRVPVKVIKALSTEELIERALGLFSSGTALKQESIELVFQLLDGLGYEWTGNEVINNREAKVILADRKGILPKKGDELFHYLYFKATGSLKTLIILNEEVLRIIEEEKWALPQLTESQLIELSKSFYRRKKFWIAIKKANKANRYPVNRIRRNAKRHHQPLPINVLGSLTSEKFSLDKVKSIAEQSSVMKIVKAINALRLYLEEPKKRFYKIRNGKGFLKDKDNSLESELLASYEEVLMEVLKNRLSHSKVWCPWYIDYAIPVSEKQFSGNVPKGTKVRVQANTNSLLAGIYWEGENSDLDLSVMNSSVKVGWDGVYRGKGFCHSGDIVKAPDGAAEWVYCQPNIINKVYIVQVNNYNGHGNKPYKFILSSSDEEDIEKNYICDPDKVIADLPCNMVQNKMLLGFIMPIQSEDGLSSDGFDFYFIDQGVGGGKTSVFGYYSGIIQDNLTASFSTQLRLKDLIEVESDPQKKEECDVVLELDSLAKDSIISLFQ